MNVGLYRRGGLLLSKRHFLQGVGGTAVGLMAAGLVGRADAAGTAGHFYEIDRKQDFDAIIVGAGSAGMPAAIFAAQRGGKVLVIEVADQLGGTLNITGGAMAAAGTKLQMRKGIEDVPQNHYDDIMRLSNNKADPAVTKLYTETAAPMVDWLEDNGLQFQPQAPVKGSGHAGFRIARYQTGTEGGRSLMKVLTPHFLKQEAGGNIRVLMRAKAAELVQGRNKAVTGVIVEDESGKRTQYNGRNVVLSTGGSMADKAVFEKWHKRPLYTRRVWAYAKGDGYNLGLGAGGTIDGGQHYLCHRGFVTTDRDYPAPVYTSLNLNTASRLPWEIEVNKQGKRYVAEDATVDILERANTQVEGMESWIVFDQEIYDKAPPLMRQSKEQLADAFDHQAMFAKSASLEALARRMALPPDALVKTVNEYNQAVASKSDALGRKHLPLPIAKPPYYIIEQKGSSVFATAGLDVDGEMRVTDARKRPISGLYAAGEVSGFWHTCGDFIVNGGALTPALCIGREIGHRILKFQA